MKLKVSIEAVGYYLSDLVGSYNAKNGTPPDDVREYESGVPNLIAALTRWEDALYIRAALDQLLDRGGLTPRRVEYLNSRGVMDIEIDELREILEYMRENIDKHFKPQLLKDIEVEFVSTGLSNVEWILQRETLNPGLGWTSILVVTEGHPCPRAGSWWSPAKINSRRNFEEGEVMPSLDGSLKPTPWIWEDANQPK